MKCPVCGKQSTVFKCDKCNDTRCNNSGPGGCASSTGPFGTGKGGNLNAQCKACGKGRYKKL